MDDRLERGYVQVYTGDGKGKTTAAIGLAVRAAGAGLRVYIAQFIKGKAYSEIEALRRFDGQITVRQFGRGCFIYDAPTEEDTALAEAGLTEVRRVLVEGEYSVVILDEANVAVTLGLFAVEQLIELIAAKPPHTELVFTGRHAPPRLVAEADLVTEMREVKHYYANAVLARTGIES
jgi:cob(I)alamin adenosyltransferase